MIILMHGCSFKPVEISSIRIKGSETLKSLMKELAHEYNHIKPGISIIVEGGGTLSGIQSLLNNEIDICSASRALLPDETKALSQKYGSIGIFTYIARDAFCIIVNKKNTIRDLSLFQIKQIFTGQITNWKELNGKNAPINVVRRNDYSGTTQFFTSRILGVEKFKGSTKIEGTLDNLFEDIGNDEDAIGYSGLFHPENIVHISINGISPTIENIKSGRYLLSRYLFLYTITEPDGIIKDFLNWITTPVGQNIIEKNGFIPLFKNSY